MAISPSGRSDVYWIDDDHYQVGNDCPSCSPSNKPEKKTYYDLYLLHDVRCVIKRSKRVVEIRKYKEKEYFNKIVTFPEKIPTKLGIELTFREAKRLKDILAQLTEDLESIDDTGETKIVKGWYTLSDNILVRAGRFLDDSYPFRIGARISKAKGPASSPTEMTPLKNGIQICEDDIRSLSKYFAEMESIGYL